MREQASANDESEYQEPLAGGGRTAWRRCQFSSNRLKKIRCCGCSLMTSSFSFTPSPGPWGSEKYPFMTSGFPGAAAFTQSSAKSLKCSWILKLGVEAAK